MGLPNKIVSVVGLLAKEESTYGTAVALSTSTDGIKMQFDDKNVATLGELTYAFDGDMGPAIRSGSPRKRVPPAGRAVGGTLPFRCKGYGAAYSASNTPNLHRILKACGYNAAVITTAGSENWAYTPTEEGLVFTSLTAEAYARGKKYPLTGMIGSLAIEARNQAPPVWTMTYRAISTALPTDIAAPSISYPNESLVEPLASAITLNLGSFLLPITNGFTFNQNRGIDFARVPLSGSSAHLGFVPQGRRATLSVTIEETNLVGTPFHTSAGIDHHSLYEAATSIAVTLTVGSVQYNKYTIYGTAQLEGPPKEGNNGPVATVELSWRFHSSADTANDDHQLVFA